MNAYADKKQPAPNRRAKPMPDGAKDPAPRKGSSAEDESANAIKLGKALKRARKAKGLSLEALSKETRIRMAHLKALEEGRLDALPGPTFVIGFLKLYARQLDLPEQDLIHQFTSEVKRKSSQLNTPFFPAPSMSRHLPKRWLVALGAMGFLGFFLLYELVLTDHSLSQLFDEMMQSPPQSAVEAPTVEQRITLSSSTPAHHDQERESSTDRKTSANAKAAETKPTSTSTELAIKLTPSPEGEQVRVEPESFPASQAIVILPNAEEIAPLDTLNMPAVDEPALKPKVKPISLLAKARVWVQIRNKNNQVVKEMTMRPGGRFDVPVESDDGPFFASLGNAGGVVIRIGDKEVSRLGRPGRVVRNLKLTEEALLKRAAR
ncbi:MAG: helix-turn-helix domain-containing protein [Magnetococcales bacterium]|nr:helix-turn-helix domain-containing protein [Magnetococcales bacterium]